MPRPFNQPPLSELPSSVKTEQIVVDKDRLRMLKACRVNLNSEKGKRLKEIIEKKYA